MKEKASKLMSLRRSVFMLLLFVFSALPLFAQQKEISGVVKDEKGETVIGAAVKVKGTDMGTVTDINGAFNFKDLPADKQVLEISYIGMDPQEVTITGEKVDVTMKEKSKELDAVVVTGYGQTKKRDLVTSISSVNADDLKNVPVTSAAEALEGKLAGVTVTQTEGSPDAATKIRVRGGGSLTQNAEPLYIVDGFPVSDISNISPTDIQSVDVLKDASATAIYGAQGANGVIIITTKDATPDKDGKSKISVDYTGYVGIKKIAKTLDVLSAADYVKLCYEKAYLAGMSSSGKYGSDFFTDLGTGSGSAFDQTMESFYDSFGYGKYTSTSNVGKLSELTNYVSTDIPTTDWQNEAFGRTGIVSNHSITISGGSKTANFNASYNRLDDKAIMVGSDYHRDNLSLKATFNPMKPLKLGFTTRFSDTRVNGSGTNSVNDAGSTSESRLRNCIAYTPIKLYTQATASSDDEESLGGLYSPLTSITDNYQYKKDTRFNINGFVSYQFMKGLTGRSELGMEIQNTKKNRYYGLTTYYAKNNQIEDTPDSTAAIIGTTERKTKFRNTNTLTYEKKIKKRHNISAMLGEEMIVNTDELNTYYGYGYDQDFSGEDCFKYWAQGTGAIISNYIAPKDNQLSFFGRGNYDYKGRYYVTGTLRADGSTRFEKGHQWGVFPSLAGAWRASDEDFMKGFKEKTSLSNLKVRLSYGMAGNNNVDLGVLHQDYYSYVSTAVSSTASTSTTVLESKNPDNGNILANTNLKWETTITRDLGIDYGFWKDRITGAVDVYWNNTKDLIVMYKLPYGYDYEYRNIGSTSNKGAEASVKAVILDKRTKTTNYGLEFNFNINTNVTKITDLGGLDTIYAGTNCFSNENLNNGSEYVVTVGGKTGNIYGYKLDGWYTASDFDGYSSGYFTKNGEKIVWNSSYSSSYYASPGMVKFQDLNGDGTINASDRTIIGNTQPLFTGGFSLSGHYGNFDFAANFNYSYGNDVLNMNKIESTTITDKSYLRNCTAEMASRYTLFDNDGVYTPSKYTSYSEIASALDELNAGATIWSPIMPAYVVSDWAVEDGSFLRFSSFTIGYTLPSKLIRKLKIQKLRFFATASNLWLWTNYSGYDPEVDTRSSSNPLTTGVDYSAYPKSKGFNVGLNLSF